MKNHLKNSCFKLKPLALGVTLIAVFGVAQAESLTEADTLLETVGDPNESKFMKDIGLKIGGWANAGITYNAAAPANNFNGPVTFGDRSGEFQLNQLNLFA
ncbi:MAG: outer membrane beta-barrel protein, partial [Methylobacter sp.]